MINFPNQSRVFDSTRRAVLFWGHDSAMEWSFFVTEDALRLLQPNVPRDEAGLLLAFDANRPLIYAAAMKAYKRDRKASYGGLNDAYQPFRHGRVMQETGQSK
jgi:hypothetical protein